MSAPTITQEVAVVRDTAPLPDVEQQGAILRTRPRPIPASWDPHWPGRAVFVTAIALVAWSLVAEPWALTGDALVYLQMAAGETVQAPFGFRVLAPWIAGILPMAPVLAFELLSWASLLVAAVALVAFARASAEPAEADRRGWIVLAFFVTSYALVYYATASVRVDPLALALLAGCLALLATGRSAGWVALLMVPTVLAHETALVLVPILWLDRLCGAGLLGRRRLSWGALLGITTVGAAAYLASRALLPAAAPEGQVSYLTTPSAILAHVIAHVGGVVKHGQRIYAAYGPALVYAALAGVALMRGRARLFVPGVLALGVGLTLLATDTLRVMAVLFPVVLLFAAQLVEVAWTRRGPALAVALVGAQCVYAGVVFGHLRTFEGSRALQLAAIGVSAVAGLAALVAARRPWRGALLPVEWAVEAPLSARDGA